MDAESAEFSLRERSFSSSDTGTVFDGFRTSPYVLALLANALASRFTIVNVGQQKHENIISREREGKDNFNPGNENESDASKNKRI